MSIFPINYVGSASLKQAGRTAALGNYGFEQNVLKAKRKRYQQLSALVQQGQLKSSQLGPNDRTLMAEGQSLVAPAGTGFHKPETGIGGAFGKVGGFLGNLAKDVGETGLYLVPGLVKTASALGQSAWQDIRHPLDFSDSALGAKGLQGSKFNREIVAPTVESYKATYGPGGGSFFENFYKHPLGPLLDVATLASGGLGAAAKVGRIAGEAGQTGRLANLARFTARAGREPLVTSTGRKIPRSYTPRPLSRLGQRHVLDPIAERVPVLRNLQLRMEERRQMRGAQADSQHERFATIADLATGTKVFGHLDPTKQQALFFSMLGINTPRRIAGFEDMVKRGSLEDERQLVQLEARDIDKRYLEHQANLPEEVKQRIIDPSDDMIEAARVWSEKVNQLRAENGVDPEMATRHIAEPQRIIDEHIREANRQFNETNASGLRVDSHKTQDVLPHPAYPIEPTYVPLSAAVGFEPARGFRRPEGMFERTGSGRLGRAIGFGGTISERTPATTRTGFVAQPQRFMHESQFETFRAGSFRTDTKAMVDHITERAKTEADRSFKLQSLQRVAAKDPDTGKLFRTTAAKVSDLTDEEIRKLMQAGVDLKDVEFVNDGFMYQFFRKNIDHLEQVRHVVDNFVRDLPDDSDLTNILSDPQMEKILEQITDADAKAFVSETWNAAKAKNHLVPKAEARYMMKLSNLDLPHSNAGMRFFGTWMNRWRNFVLTYMPRWWLNTAAGSFLMNVIQGVDLHDYMVARRLQKQGKLPAKVNLGHQPLIEYEEAAAQYGRQMMPSMPTRKIQGRVQSVENYFRRASFIHQLKREHRLTRDHKGEPVDPEENQAQALEDMGGQLQEHFEEVFGKHKGNIEEALSDPRTVARALKEVDKFSYNYSILGPSERKYVRQFVPFWGWYKFISMAAYRLPVEMPGRVTTMRWLSNVAAEEEASMGTIPPWVEGAIPISLGGGRYTYLSSLGINPFSSFFNPGGRKGLIGGILSPTQLNPVLQAGMSAVGFDPLSGGGVRISPQSGVGTDFLGRLVDENTGQPVNLTEREGGWRLLHALGYSLPQVRTGFSGDTGQFPESVPFIHERPLPGVKGQRPTIENITGPFEGSGFIQGLQEKLGILPFKDYDLSKQVTAAKAAEYVRRKNQRARLRNP